MFTELITNLDGRQRGDLHLHELLDASNAIFKLFIDRVERARTHRVPTPDSKYGEADGEHCKIPRREADTNGAKHHSSSLSRTVYPNPRTVWMSRPALLDSSLCRSWKMNTSNVLLPTSRSIPQTASIRSSRDTTRPARCNRYSRRTNSVRVRVIGWPPR